VAKFRVQSSLCPENFGSQQHTVWNQASKTGTYESRAADSGVGPGEKIFGPPQLKADRLKIFTLHRKDWLLVEEWLGIGLKVLINISYNDTTEKTYATQLDPLPDCRSPLIRTASPPPPKRRHCMNLQHDHYTFLVGPSKQFCWHALTCTTLDYWYNICDIYNIILEWLTK
jgi:hypothetical protein